MPATIKDIAQRAKVSPSTVSRALQNHPRISAKMRAYIQELAIEMGYVPSAVARNLVAKKSATIGVAITDLVDPYYSDLMLGIEKAAASNNYQVLIISFYKDRTRELEVIHNFHQRRVDGIIVTGSMNGEAPYLAEDNNFFMPTVLVNSPNYPFSVSADRFLGAKAAVEHLIELGHRRIAHITWGSEHPDQPNRLEGYQAALQENDIPLDDSLIALGDGSIAGGIKAAEKLFTTPAPPTAIFCFNDMTAIGVVNALRQKGYEVPLDVSVVGYDDVDIVAYHHPPLTTVRQPAYLIGKRATKMLFRLIAGDHDISPEILETELIIRQSTAPNLRG